VSRVILLRKSVHRASSLVGSKSGRWSLAIAVLALVAGALAWLAHTPDRQRIMVLGMDGVDPQVVDRLASEGKLPNFLRLRREGAVGMLEVDPPLLSPVIWTTIATGKQPLEHGIGHFTAVLAEDGEAIPVTSTMRRVPALWNIFSDAGRSVAVVGWWATWPAEPVRGQVISDRTCYHLLNRQGADPGAPEPGTIYPAGLTPDVLARVKRFSDVGSRELAPFVRVDPADLARPFDFGDDLSHLRWALAAAQSYRDIGLHLWRIHSPDLLLVYIEAVDSTSHLFGHLYRHRGLKGELAEQQRRFGQAVEAVYAYADSIVGAFLSELDRSTTLIVLSDHGFMLGELPADPSTTRDLRRVSDRYHRDRGILYLYGAGVKKGAALRRPHALDITPTVLALAGLAWAEDMPGRPLREALVESDFPEPITSYRLGPNRTKAPAGPARAASDEAMLAKLRSLGYLGSVQSTTSDRNLAMLLLRERRFHEAARAFEELLKAQPGNAALETGLASALSGAGRNREALHHFDAALQADPLFPAAYFNRGLTCERLGRREQAIASYRTALMCDGGYEPARKALERLGVPLVERPPQTEAEREAARLLGLAMQFVRRGDYQAAEADLGRARELAPRAPAVYQVIANVAYLQGDPRRAIEALEIAIELEPDNPLFLHNLERLRRAVE